MSGITDRKQEIKRRRHRREKYAKFVKKLENANASERATIAEKLRKMTPGCEVLIARWGLEER